MCSTSCFKRRSRYGASTLCKVSTCLAAVIAPNADSNSSLDAKRPASTKLSSDHSSAVSFCSGVPVSSTTLFAKSSVRRSRCAFPPLFFSLCASSITRHDHGIFASADRSA